jgi:hypothetical protein
LGACNKPLERYFQELSSGISKAPKFLKLQLVNLKKQICNRLVTAYQGGQKNRNGQTIAVLYYHFLLVLAYLVFNEGRVGEFVVETLHKVFLGPL